MNMFEALKEMVPVYNVRFVIWNPELLLTVCITIQRVFVANY